MRFNPRLKRRLRKVVCVVLAVTFVGGITIFYSPHASAFACASNGHCYGEIEWNGAVNGAETDITVVHLTCTGCYSGGEVGFVNNEVWVVDQDTYGPYWVEVGYATWSKTSTTSEHYFWADKQPPLGSYAEHDMGIVPSGDYGNRTYFYINRESSSSFRVYASSDYFYNTGLSTGNYMIPDQIQLGEELFGDSGYMSASAPRAYYTQNKWISTSGVEHYQTVNGTKVYNNPPYVGWSTTPSTSNSQGGTLWTNCC